jgi:periplasmic protein TonB
LARALEVTLTPPQPLPELPTPEVARTAVVHARAVHKPRAARVISRVPVHEQVVTPPISTATAESSERTETASKPLLVQEGSKPATVELAPAGGTEVQGMTRTGQKDTVAAVKPSDPIVPPSFNASYLRNPPPRYPLAARLNGEQGTVTLKVLVTQQGLPGSVTLEKTSGSALLDAAALQTVRRWRFAPARRAQEAVDAWVIVPIVFRLEDAS